MWFTTLYSVHQTISDELLFFSSISQAHAVEARSVVRQALDVLTPAMPSRMEDGNQMLTHWTRKIIVEEGHTLAQLMHVLILIVRHHKVNCFPSIIFLDSFISKKLCFCCSINKFFLPGLLSCEQRPCPADGSFYAKARICAQY